MTTLIDTCVIINLTRPESKYHSWSVEALRGCRINGPVVVSEIIYCEFSIGMASQAEADAVIRELALERIQISDAALFRAGRAFKTYKEQNSGPKLNVLPDFLIGAMAETSSLPLPTSNPGDFTSYFPLIQMISPP